VLVFVGCGCSGDIFFIIANASSCLSLDGVVGLLIYHSKACWISGASTLSSREYQIILKNKTILDMMNVPLPWLVKMTGPIRHRPRLQSAAKFKRHGWIASNNR